MQEPFVDFHLHEVLSHLDAALNKSILHVQADTSAKKKWDSNGNDF
ncbi:hypothetical protein ACJ7K1_26950 [Paenibacillus elgii]